MLIRSISPFSRLTVLTTRTPLLFHRTAIFDASLAPSPTSTQTSAPTEGSSDDPPPSGKSRWKMNSLTESVLGTLAGIVLLSTAGVGYHHWYKKEVLRKMRRSFAPGYDPVLELARASGSTVTPGKIRRKEQAYIDKVMNGEISGSYLLLLGPKGSGKSSLLVESLIKNQADGVAMMEAHEDPEVFRLRLGKALDFEYSEDSFAGLFQRKDPREAGPSLDIERALNKLEHVAIKFRLEKNRPLVLVFNNIHFVHDDEAGHALLHMLQQRAESWAQAGVVTTVFASDNFGPYRHLRKNATRMQVLAIRDLNPHQTHQVLSDLHTSHFPTAPSLAPSESIKVWNLLGGRIALLQRIGASEDKVSAAKELIESEKGWLLHRLGLIPDLDDDVMDEQKVSSCSFLLFQEFARLAEESAAEVESLEVQLFSSNSESDHSGDTIEINAVLEAQLTEAQDPRIEYRRAREIMTRPDYLSDLDYHNILNIDVHHHVRPDSRMMLSVFREICAEPDFQDKLDNVRARVDEIESLHRTSELTVKKVGEGDLGGFLRLKVGALKMKNKVQNDGEEHETERTV